DGGQPVEGLGIEVGVAREAAAIEEALAHVANGPLDFALGLGAVRPAGADAEAPVGGEAQELGILDDAPALGTVIVDDHGLQLIEEQLGRDTAEEVEGLLEPPYERQHGLAAVELEPEEARIAQHHHQREALAPGEVDL